MNRPVHFEYHSSDPQRAQTFFENVFGWKFSAWNGPEEYWLVHTGDNSLGINGGLMRSRDGQPRTVNTVQVQHLETTVGLAEKNGGQIVVPRMPIPGVGWLAYLVEPTGNLLGIMQPDSNAR